MIGSNSSPDSSPLRFRGVSFEYARRPILKDFDLELRPGEVTLLAAPNGSGKTTVQWLAAGLLRPARGEVLVFGVDPYQRRDILGRVGFLAEGAPLPGWTAQQVLDFQRDTFPRWDAQECRRLLDRFGLNPSQRVQRLSRGERGKLALVAVLATRPELLLLDEPTLGLDLATRRLFAAELLGRLAQDGCTVLLSSHEIAEAERGADRFVLLAEGQARCNEPIADLLERHRLLSWEAPTPLPPGELEVLELPGRMGQRALARRWDPTLAGPWLRAGGRESVADLETIYLSLTGEVTHA